MSKQEEIKASLLELSRNVQYINYPYIAHFHKTPLSEVKKIIRELCENEYIMLKSDTGERFPSSEITPKGINLFRTLIATPI